MKPGELTNLDDLIQAAIVWDEEKLRGSNDPGAVHFYGVMSLLPSHLNYDSEISKLIESNIPVDLDSPLFRAGEAIRRVLEGQPDGVGDTLHGLGADGTLPWLLGALLSAWLDDNPVTQLAAISEVLLDGKLVSKWLRPRVFLKLMTWAHQAGETLAAGEYYDQAVKFSSGPLRDAIRTQGSVFGRDAYFQTKPVTAKLVTYPKITSSVAQESNRQLIRAAEDIFKGPWTKTWGRSTIPQTIEAAELQAGWIGALWILGPIRRTKAAILFKDGNQPSERVQALTDWVASGGGDVRRIFTESERYLDEESIEDLLTRRLLGGVLARSNKDWYSICLSLWDELPTSIASNLIDNIEIDARAHEWRTDQLPLFGVLSQILPEKWAKRYLSLKADDRAVAVRYLSPLSIRQLPESILDDLAESFFVSLEKYGEGETSVYLAMASLVAKPSSPPQLFARFVEQLPDHVAPTIVLKNPSLKTEQILAGIQRSLSISTDAMRQDLADVERGAFSQRGRDPRLSAAICMLALGAIDRTALDLIIETAVHRLAVSEQVLSSLRALTWLADDGLLDTNDGVVQKIGYRSSDSPLDQFWDGPGEVRLINVAVASFVCRFNLAEFPKIIAGARDSDRRVRSHAIENLIQIVEENSDNVADAGLSAASDTAIMGAIYDPDASVQAAGVAACNLLGDVTLLRIAWARVHEVWDTAPKQVRIAAASASAQAQADGSLKSLEPRRLVHEMAQTDRSLLVRRAAERP